MEDLYQYTIKYMWVLEYLLFLASTNAFNNT